MRAHIRQSVTTNAIQKQAAGRRDDEVPRRNVPGRVRHNACERERAEKRRELRQPREAAQLAARAAKALVSTSGGSGGAIPLNGLCFAAGDDGSARDAARV